MAFAWKWIIVNDIDNLFLLAIFYSTTSEDTAVFLGKLDSQKTLWFYLDQYYPCCNIYQKVFYYLSLKNHLMLSQVDLEFVSQVL